jgi:hypothetical protein
MLLVLSLLIQTGDSNCDIAIRYVLFVVAISYFEGDDYTQKFDYDFNLNQSKNLDLSKIPEDCQENYAYALNILSQFQDSNKLFHLSLVYLHEPHTVSVRAPAYVCFQQDGCSIHLSRTVLRKDLFTREEIKSIIYHEIGHFLDKQCQKNYSNFSFFRMLLIAFFYTNLSISCETVLLNNPYKSLFASLILNIIIYSLLNDILCKLHGYEYFADQSSIIHGQVPIQSAITALEKIYKYSKNENTQWVNLLYPLKKILFYTHPSMVDRCEQLKKLDAVPQFFSTQTKELNKFSSEMGFIC